MRLLRSISRPAAGRTVLAVVGISALVALNSCTGGCSRTETLVPAAEVPEVPVDGDDPATILDSTQDFDERTLAEYADKVVGDTVLTAAETARLIVVTEAAVNHLGQIVDELERNDDPADTWNAVNELCALRWPGDIACVTAYLHRAPLDSVERERTEAMDAAIDRIVKTAERATNGIHNVPSIKDKIIDSEI